MGIGIIVRNHTGEAHACLSSLEKFSLQPILAESKALWRAIEFCNEIGLSQVELEGDAQVDIKVVNSEAKSLAWFGGIVKDVKAVLK